MLFKQKKKKKKTRKKKEGKLPDYCLWITIAFIKKKKPNLEVCQNKSTD